MSGDRIALNLTGLDKEDVQRGAMVETRMASGAHQPRHRCTVFPGGDLHPRQRVRIHLGTARFGQGHPVEGVADTQVRRGFVHFQWSSRWWRSVRPVRLPQVFSRVPMGGGVVLYTGTPNVRARFPGGELTHLEVLILGDLADVYGSHGDSPRARSHR